MKKVWLGFGLGLLVVLGLVALVFRSKLEQGSVGKNNEPAVTSPVPKGSVSADLKNASDSQLQAELDKCLAITDFYQRTKRMRDIFAAWALKDPEAAARAIERLDHRYRDYGATASVAEALSKKDVMSAFSFAELVDDPHLADFIQQVALKIWGNNDPKAAALYALKNFPQEKRGAALGVFTADWAKKNGEEALEFSQAIPDVQTRNYSLCYVYKGWALKDPAAAAKSYVDTIKSDNASRDAMAYTISAIWSSQDPAAATKWAAALKDDSARSVALKESVATWASKDPVKASDFMTSLPSGDSRDEIATVFVGAVVQADPDTAMEWAKSIGNQQERRVAFERIADYYSKQDGSQAQAWLQSIGNLPPDWQLDLKQRVGEKR